MAKVTFDYARFCSLAKAIEKSLDNALLTLGGDAAVRIAKTDDASRYRRRVFTAITSLRSYCDTHGMTGGVKTANAAVAKICGYVEGAAARLAGVTKEKVPGKPPKVVKTPDFAYYRLAIERAVEQLEKIVDPPYPQDGPDGVGSFWWKGTQHRLPAAYAELVQVLWKCGRREEEDLVACLGETSDAAKSKLKRLNKWFLDRTIAVRISQEKGFLVLHR